MVHLHNSPEGIPVSPELSNSFLNNDAGNGNTGGKKRLIYIAFCSVLVALGVSVIAKVLIYLIAFFTNISFFGRLSVQDSSPADNHLGLWVIIIPVIGGIVVGLMAYFGSKAIRGHGIPEAMEQILTNQSKINPAITWLKPVSSAISIGTGGPFGAEGPIIATGGALGSTLGQLLHITHHERKILLAAGATAGMASIFGSPVAAIFLAIELLLFEFSPRSIIPVALACVTGAAGHHFFFHPGAVFPMPEVAIPGNAALAWYSIIGLLMGLIATLVTKAVYFVEDSFEKLPVHWMWWPAIGALATGIIGYFAPRTLGVGYQNITDVLSGNLAFKILLSLSILKFLSWVIALGSGTSGGTLAPLLTIGGATGGLLGMGVMHLFPESGVILPVAAVVGMSAMFAGASRAVLTSIIFALETTGQNHTLLPLLGGCMGSYIISYLLMENTIMTEKIARRGVKTPYSYEPDVLEKLTVGEVIRGNWQSIAGETSIIGVRDWLRQNSGDTPNYLIVTEENAYIGIVNCADIYAHTFPPDTPVKSLIRNNHVSVHTDSSLSTAAEMMGRENTDMLPVVSGENRSQVIGILSSRDIIIAYNQRFQEHEKTEPVFRFKK